MYPDFPLLKKDQIEVKVKQVTAKGAVVLLYKTARVDMDMLDSVVGPMNWQNCYEDIDGVLYCSIAIREPDTGNWVSKSDCGIESRADGDGNEKKGEASDAFKRAGFRWGIGRELYSSPFTFLSVPTKQSARGGYELEDKFAKFSVGHIDYDDNRKISELIIVDQNGKEVFKFPKNMTAKPAAKKAELKPEKKVEKKPQAPVITGSVENTTPPWLINPDEVDEIPQEQLTNIVKTYTKDLDDVQRRKVLAQIKKINGGTACFNDVPDPKIRREMYNYFWNLMNEIPQ